MGEYLDVATHLYVCLDYSSTHKVTHKVTHEVTHAGGAPKAVGHFSVLITCRMPSLS